MGTASPHRHRIVGCLLAAGASALAAMNLTACNKGERAELHACPQGERCSNETPGGLEFLGPRFTPDGFEWRTVGPIAVGGSTTITLIDRGTGHDLTLPFTAQTTGASLGVGELRAGSVRVLGLAPGSGLLRILSARDGLLFDRYDVQALPLERFILDRSDHGALLRLRAPTPTLVIPRGSPQFSISLRSGSAALVDDGLTVTTPPGADVRVEQTFWNTFTLRAPRAATVPLTITHGGGSVRRFDLRVTEGMGEIVALPAGAAARSLDVTVPIPFPEGTYCFGLMLDGTRVTPEAWTFRATGGHRSLTPEANCVTVGIPYEGGGGGVVLDVSAGTLSQEFLLTPSR